MPIEYATPINYTTIAFSIVMTMDYKSYSNTIEILQFLDEVIKTENANEQVLNFDGKEMGKDIAYYRHSLLMQS
jgi:hypothetical protein